MNDDPLKNISYISINNMEKVSFNDFIVNPDILLPIEMNSENWSHENISWEAIIGAMLKLLAYKPDDEHSEYYKHFILAVKPDIKDEFTEAGILKARNKNFDLSIEIFKALHGLFPDCVRTQLNLAIVYEDRARHYERIENQGMAEEYTEYAFKAYKEAVTIDPVFADTHFNFAHFYMAQNSFIKAKDHFTLFCKYGKDPEKIKKAESICKKIDSWGERDNLFKNAFDLISIGREVEGIRKIKTFIDENPEVWNAWFLLGWGYRRLNRYKDAKEAFRNALKLNGKHPDILNELAICHMELGEFDESYSKLKAALKLDSDNTKIISNLGILAIKKGNTTEAISFFETVLDYDRNDSIALKYLKQLKTAE